MNNQKLDSANASPTKEFFVNMITKDISLEDSILDLIDNSIDAAKHSSGSQPMTLGSQIDLSQYTISIKLSSNSFIIVDNCGGMTLDNAIKHAFSFGRKPGIEPEQYGIGVYGIGMKRAAFKLGRDITVRSTYVEGNRIRQSFKVPIDVEEWLKSKIQSWDFDIVEAEDMEENGVEIQVRNLTSAAKNALANPAFVQNLRRMLARDYSLYLNKGLNLIVNGERISGLHLEFAGSEEFVPMRISYNGLQNGDEIFVEMIGGMAAPPPDSTEPDEKQNSDKRFGWYIACNGRIVLAADKTEVSGWGTTNWPQWHRQYAGFMGIVLFSAYNTAALPLTTTKRSVDLTSDVYKTAQVKMRDLTKEWINYTNERKQALDAAKEKEARAKAIPIQQVENRESIALPKLPAVKPVERPANVQYSVPVKRMKRLAGELGNINLPYREVGLRSFEYTYEDLVGEE